MANPLTTGIPRVPQQPDTRTKRAIDRLADDVDFLAALTALGVGSSAVKTLLASPIPSDTISDNTTNEQFFATTFTLTANTLNVVNQVLDLRLRGVFEGASNPPTLKVSINIGGSDVMNTLDISYPGSAGTAYGWEVDASFIVQTTGASGVLVAQGKGIFNSTAGSGAAVVDTFIPGNPPTISLDLTVDHVIKIGVKYNSTDIFGVMALNQFILRLWSAP